MSVTINGTNGLTFNDASTQTTAATGFGFKNRIINGAMVIDQRNAGASVTVQAYTVDRWQTAQTTASKLTAQQQTSVVPVGFTYAEKITSTSAYTITSGDVFTFIQAIEGYNVADLEWGTANAKTVTLSFQVYSSLTGTFGGSIGNGTSFNRSYPFTYSIPVANTWTTISITIVGDTTGTWDKTNGNGMYVNFGLGVGSTYSGTAGAWAAADYRSATGAVSVVGTNGATFYVTGVQLEKGSTATSFDYRPYGTELALCQRYYEKSYNMASIAGASTNTNKGSFVTGAAANTFWRWTQNYRVSKRADSTFTIYSTTGASGNVRLNNASDLAVTTEDAGENACAVYVSRNASLGDFFWWQWTASAEL